MYSLFGTDRQIQHAIWVTYQEISWCVTYFHASLNSTQCCNYKIKIGRQWGAVTKKWPQYTRNTINIRVAVKWRIQDFPYGGTSTLGGVSANLLFDQCSPRTAWKRKKFGWWEVGTPMVQYHVTTAIAMAAWCYHHITHIHSNICGLKIVAILSISPLNSALQTSSKKTNFNVSSGLTAAFCLSLLDRDRDRDSQLDRGFLV